MRALVVLRRPRADPDGTPDDRPLGACDDAALEAALAGRRVGDVSSVTALAVGPAAREDEALRHALARGADRAVRVDPGPIEAIDYFAVARVLAAAAGHVGWDVVLAGDRSEDEGQGAVGPALAELLDVPHLTGAHDVRLGDARAVALHRDGGVVRTVGVRLPAVIAVASQTAASPHDASPPAGGGVEILDLAHLGLQAAELRHRDRCVGRAAPWRTTRAVVVADAADLVARLRRERLL